MVEHLSVGNDAVRRTGSPCTADASTCFLFFELDQLFVLRVHFREFLLSFLNACCRDAATTSPHPAASKQTGNFNPKPSDVANPAE